MSTEPWYREWQPPVGLRDAVACFWLRVAPDAGDTVRVLPDGCVDLIWQQGQGAFVAGPDTGPIAEELRPGTVLVGARFLPGAGGAALGVALAELRNQRVWVADVDRRLHRSLPAGLSRNAAVDGLIRLVMRLVSDGPPDPMVVEAVRLLDHPRMRSSALVRILGVSDRQLRRRFDAAIGYGPKTLQRVLRFRHFLAHARAEAQLPNLAQAAIRSGYADQSHLSREAIRLASLTPAALLRMLHSEPRLASLGLGDPRSEAFG